MAKIIITDLTRFWNQEFVCTAGICTQTGECIRPVLPYLRYADCERLEILPGTILSGDFCEPESISSPHTEDRKHSNLTYHGSCSAEDFQEVLESSLSESVSEGFALQLEPRQKHVPIEHDLSHSIITLKVPPTNIEIIKDAYNEGRIKFNFIDNDMIRHMFWPITDLGFYNYALRNIKKLENINDYIHRQNELYLRIGIGRAYQPPNQPNGYWFQINGIYTFPEYNRDIRSY